MAQSLNKVMLIGHLIQDPIVKNTSNNVATVEFSIETKESWKDQQGNQQEKSEKHNIVAENKLAEICGKYLKTRKQIYIEGKVQTRNYTHDGVKVFITEIIADKMIMVDGGGAAGSFTNSKSKYGKTESISTIRNNDSEKDVLPF